MELATYSQLKTKLMNDLDVEDLDFINGETELLGYINEAIDDAEGLVHTLGLDSHYFLTQGAISFVSGTADYVLPSDIYANKIKKMMYVNGGTKYEIFRVRNLEEPTFFQAGDDYKYLPLALTAGTANNMRLRFYPTPPETGSFVTIWYIRNMAKLTTSTASTNVCEMPEFSNTILQHCKVRIYEKMGNPNLDVAARMLEAQWKLMTDTLQEMVPDANTIIEPDLSFYEDTYIDYRRNF